MIVIRLTMKCGLRDMDRDESTRGEVGCVAETRMLIRICGVTMLERKRNYRSRVYQRDNENRRKFREISKKGELRWRWMCRSGDGKHDQSEVR